MFTMRPAVSDIKLPIANFIYHIRCLAIRMPPSCQRRKEAATGLHGGLKVGHSGDR